MRAIVCLPFPDVSRLATFFGAASRQDTSNATSHSQTFHVWLPSLAPLRGKTHLRRLPIPDVSRLATFFSAASRQVTSNATSHSQTFHVWLPSLAPLRGESPLTPLPIPRRFTSGYLL